MCECVDECLERGVFCDRMEAYLAYLLVFFCELATESVFRRLCFANGAELIVGSQCGY